MNIIPDSDIILLKCPLELDNKNQITFSSSETQFNYFNSLPKISLDSASYVRKDETIRVPELLEDILQYNYLMYRNHNYSNKWIYAFITDSEYMNDNCTSISFETDVFQTWQFDLEYKDSFVIREHTNNDTIGANIIDEDLNIGETEIIGKKVEGYGVDTSSLVIMSTYDPNDTSSPDFSGITTFNGSVFGCEMWAFAISNEMSLAQSFIDSICTAGKKDSIQGMFTCPSDLLIDYIGENHKLDTNLHPNISEFNFLPKSNTNSYSDYVPKNNKCYCSPYHFLEVSNSNGEKQQYKIENFVKDENGNVRFKNVKGIQVGITGRLYPFLYNGSQDTPTEYGGFTFENSDLSVSLPKFPTCQWATDYYTNWLTQNSVNRIRQAGTLQPASVNSESVFNPLSIENIIGAGTQGAASTVANYYGKFAEAAMQSNQVAGDNTGDITFALDLNGYTLLEKRCKLQFLKQIDDYFSMYGYKTNRLKVPNITGRSNWNYVETQNINIIADIPQNDLNLIKEMFNNGITLWHTTNYFLDYSRTNSIV